MKRRRLLIALTLLMGVTAFAAWKLTHQRDPRLVGRWLVTYDMRPTSEAYLAITDTMEFVPETYWRVSEDGIGQVEHNFLATYADPSWDRFRWWTRGDRLHLQWTSDRTPWTIQDSAEDLYRVMRGEPTQHPIREYACIVEGPDLIRLEPKDLPWRPSYHVIYLTRLPEDAS